MSDRFELEEHIQNMNAFTEEFIETLIYAVGDCEKRPTEDDLLNMLIGFKTSVNFKHHQLWSCFEQLISKGIIKSTGYDNEDSES